MRSKQSKPQHVVSRRKYSPTSLTKAYLAVKEDKLSVYKAAKMHKVPEQTLRDRVLGKIELDTNTTGRCPVLSLAEEAKLVSHLQDMAKYGYMYIRQEVCEIATDYAIQLGKRTKESPLTLNWFTKFVKRWPQLRELKSKGLGKVGDKSVPLPNVSEYFKELETILDKYQLRDSPHLIYNIDEIEIAQNHDNSDSTSSETQNTTIIGCGSASGDVVPPCFIFEGKRLVPDLMKGASPEADCKMSDTGSVNADIFRYYMKHHLTKFLPQVNNDQHLLVIIDGHKSHVSVDLFEWAEQQHIKLFIIPAQYSQILQPLVAGCYGQFESKFDSTCNKIMEKTAVGVSRYNICEISCKVYSKALSAENLKSAFMTTGIYPFDSTVISNESLATLEMLYDSDIEDSIESDASHKDK